MSLSNVKCRLPRCLPSAETNSIAIASLPDIHPIPPTQALRSINYTPLYLFNAHCLPSFTVHTRNISTSLEPNLLLLQMFKLAWKKKCLVVRYNIIIIIIIINEWWNSKKNGEEIHINAWHIVCFTLTSSFVYCSIQITNASKRIFISSGLGIGMVLTPH